MATWGLFVGTFIQLYLYEVNSRLISLLIKLIKIGVAGVFGGSLLSAVHG